LFELITGAPPVKVSGLSINEAVTRLRTAHGSAHASIIGGSRDLASIYQKATQADPTQRYASAGELGDDLRRWVAHEPVRAQRPTLRYTITKWARRNPALLGMSIAAGLVAIIGLGAFAWQARLTHRSSLVAQQEAKSAEAVTRFIERTFSSVDARSEGPNARVADMLERAATINERENADSPEVMARLASLFGRSFLSLGMRDRSEAQLRLAVSTFPAHDSEHALVARQFLANVLRHTRRREEGLELAKGVLADRERVSGPRAPQTLFARRSRGLQRLALGDAEGAAADLREALNVYASSGQQDDSDAMHASSDLAMALAAMGDRDQAIAILDAAYEQSSRMLKPAHPTTLNISSRLAGVLIASNQAARAEAICRAELDRASASLTPWHPVRMRLVTELGRALRVQGKLDEAIAMLREANAIQTPSQVDLSAITDLWAQLARALLDTGQPEEAAPLIQAVIEADRDEPRHHYSGAARRAELLGLAP
jgi:tetratricopeptide (TPR) repeat protein